jgi:hypothetical protein
MNTWNHDTRVMTQVKSDATNETWSHIILTYYTPSRAFVRKGSVTSMAVTFQSFEQELQATVPGASRLGGR